jgi:hypothetical protein
MRRNTAKILASAAFGALVLPWTAVGQTIGISIGVRETQTTAAVGEPGGTNNGIEWINRDGQFLTLNDTWQTFTWNFGTDPVLAFAGATANGTLDGTRGVLEHVRLLNGIGSADEFEIFFDNIVNTVGGTPTTITGFEADEPVPALTTDLNGAFMFREPRFSGSTDFNLAATPNVSVPTNLVADTGAQSLRLSWAFLDANPTRWVRLTTFGAPKRPNPTIDYTSGNTLTMRVRGRLLEPAVRFIATGPGPVNWSDPANWNGGTVPGISFATTEVAYFGTAITTPTTVNVDVPISLNTLRLNNANAYTFNTADPLSNNITLAGPLGSTANINAQTGSHVINVPILLTNRTLSVTVGQADAVLQLNGGVNFDSVGTGIGQSLIKEGPGTVVLPSFRSFVDNPDDTPPTPPNPSKTVTVNAGTLRLAQSAGAPVVSRTNRIIMAGTTDAWTGRIDVTNNAIIIDVADPTLGGTDQLSLQENRLKQGFAGGSWNGNGISSSTAAANPGHAVGIVSATDIGSPTTYLGEPIDATTVLIRYTRAGDANLDGITNIGDFSIVGANFNQAGRWATGDVNYDGQVNIGDFSLVAANFNQSAAEPAARGGAVPEPASLSLLAAAGLMGLRRRR